MALEKKSIPINFSRGVDTKSDDKQIPIGNFLSLKNSVFTKAGLLQKRNGYGNLTALPNASYNSLTTFGGNLTAISNVLSAYSAGSDSWVNKGSLQQARLSVLPLIRSNTNQTAADSVVAPNNLVCTVYSDLNAGVTTHKYAISDYNTDQNIVLPSLIVPSAGTVTGSARVFLLGKYFVIVYDTLVGGTNHLQYIAINTAIPTSVTTPSDISTLYTPAASTLAFDGVVVGSNLYLAWNGSGGDIRMTYITSTLQQQITTNYAGEQCTIMSMCADTSTPNVPIIWAAYYNSSGTIGKAIAVDSNLNTILPPTTIIPSGVVTNLNSVSQNGLLSFFYEISNTYGYDATIRTDFIRKNTLTQAGVLGTASVMLRSVGLASKAFLYLGEIFFLVAYQSVFQPGYFLVDNLGRVVAKIAYQNGGGYLPSGLPSADISGSTVRIAYLFKDLIQSVNKNVGVANAAGIYSQTGVNLASINLNPTAIVSAEIANDLQLSGGITWMYDGYAPVELGFNVYPENLEGVGTGTGGAMSAQKYYYSAIYEWTDGQGNIHRSAPSIPALVDMTSTVMTPVTTTSVFTSGVSSITVATTTGLQVGQVITDTTTGGNIAANTYITSIVGTTVGLSNPTLGASASSPGDTLSTSTVGSATINVPTDRITYKIASPIKIVLYRWSTAQENFYQVTSITSPTLNNVNIDYVTITDTQSDNAILGNSLLYTTGGVIENIGPPAFNEIALFNNRLWGIDAEDQNLLWYSKQIIENTPVEMSDLLTVYVAPASSAQGPTGPLAALSPMDDKLILFKRNAISYINGTGPDNTGANSQYSDPIFVTSTVGSSNQQSIVFMPNGLMFQSDKGIWLLSRSLETSYIGAPVEAFTAGATVMSAVNVPGTNQVRFTLDTGITLMYDYYFEQWGTFVNVPAISSTLYTNLHTYIDKYGRVFQETPSKYLDGSNPVLMSFTTGWLNVTGLQGFERAYELYLIGTYFSPHKLSVQVGYDYNPSPSQTSSIQPDNWSPTYGGDPLYGDSQFYGGPSNLEQWRVFFQQQKCQAFQISISESYDSTLGVVAGQGLTLSGLNMTVGMKSSRPKLRASRQVG